MEKDIKNILNDLYDDAVRLSFKIVDDRLNGLDNENEPMCELEQFLVGTMQNITVCLEQIENQNWKDYKKNFLSIRWRFK